ncbi:unnamed protein product [Ostreobium quekettii]|uniref:Uncharacterized protein n=1 Tax=Ostreobium quekettii TaxID=121088 RepID=A0A8S1J8H6_9CHLO|nr:unnamed protein product [Ostreobium quekettii]|eukprot:evm.model.scf_523.3 EVM.evm.TU.scf_523.3   scf_523:37222-37713(+)
MQPATRAPALGLLAFGLPPRSRHPRFWDRLRTAAIWLLPQASHPLTVLEAVPAVVLRGSLSLSKLLVGEGGLVLSRLVNLLKLEERTTLPDVDRLLIAQGTRIVDLQWKRPGEQVSPGQHPGSNPYVACAHMNPWIYEIREFARRNGQLLQHSELQMMIGLSE